ncbi:MAG: hypothetical protein E6K72_06490, partial [Candidatus Eisenbacteria bacterium]
MLEAGRISLLSAAKHSASCRRAGAVGMTGTRPTSPENPSSSPACPASSGSRWGNRRGVDAPVSGMGRLRGNHPRFALRPRSARLLARAQARDEIETRRLGTAMVPGRRAPFWAARGRAPRGARGTVRERAMTRATLAVIPARHGAVRFPGKPLARLWGKPMLQHVWERACAARGIDRLVIATDDERIARVAREFGADVEMTSLACASGTDRVAEVARRHPECAIVLNLQGDEPELDSEAVSALVAGMRA